MFPRCPCADASGGPTDNASGDQRTGRKPDVQWHRGGIRAARFGPQAGACDREWNGALLDGAVAADVRDRNHPSMFVVVCSATNTDHP